MGFMGRFLSVLSLAGLLAGHGCSKRPRNGAPDQAASGASEAEQAEREPPAEVKSKLPPPLPDMSE